MALGNTGQPTGADPFYNYQQFQKDPNFDWTKTPAIGGPSGYIERNPDVAYTRHMGQLGVGLANPSPFGEYVQNYERQQAQTGYGAALAEDPTLLFQNYLKTLGDLQDLYNRFSRLSPRQRGLYQTGPTRTIADI